MRPDGSEWDLGAGSFGKVVKGLVNGEQVLAVHRWLLSFLPQTILWRFMATALQWLLLSDVGPLIKEEPC